MMFLLVTTVAIINQASWFATEDRYINHITFHGEWIIENRKGEDVLRFVPSSKRYDKKNIYVPKNILIKDQYEWIFPNSDYIKWLIEHIKENPNTDWRVSAAEFVGQEDKKYLLLRDMDCRDKIKTRTKK